MDGVAIVPIAGIHQVRDQARALHVLQESDSQSGAFVRAFNQAGNVGDHKRAPVARSCVRIGGNHPQMRLQRGEWIRGNLRLRRGDARDERRFPRVRKTHQPHVRQQFQFEAQMALFARAAIFVFCGRLMPRPYEARIAIAAASASAAWRRGIAGPAR